MVTISQFKEKDQLLYCMVRNLQAGDANAFNKIYELSEKYIFKIINDILKDTHQTEDVMPETYIQIYTKINSLQSPEAFYVWAGRIATNFTYRYVQKYRREILAPPSENMDEDDDSAGFLFDRAAMDNEAFIPENVLMDRTKQKMISDILDSLSTEQKLSVQYYYYEELSVGEIAELMGCSTGTVKSRLNYARTAIKKSVLNIERTQDTKLYSFGGVPLLFVIFRYASEELFSLGISSAGIMAAVTKSVTTPGMAVAGLSQGASLNAASTAGSVTSTASLTTATTATGTATAVTGSVGVKIAVVALAGLLTVGGSVKTISEITQNTERSYYTTTNSTTGTTTSPTANTASQEELTVIRKEYESVLNRYEEMGIDTEIVEEEIYNGSDYRTEAYAALNAFSKAFDNVYSGYQACMTSEEFAAAKTAYLDTANSLVAEQAIVIEDVISFVEKNSNDQDAVNYFNQTIYALNLSAEVMEKGNVILRSPVSKCFMQGWCTASDVTGYFNQGMNALDMILEVHNTLADRMYEIIDAGYFSENEYDEWYDLVSNHINLSNELYTFTQQYTEEMMSNDHLLELLGEHVMSAGKVEYYQKLQEMSSSLRR